MNTFQVTSGKIRITDPCYDKGTWCAGTVPAENGVWSASVEKNREGRIATLNANLIGGNYKKLNAVKLDIDVGVDSGQCGFFDDAKFPDGDPGEYGDMSTFYGRACEKTVYENSEGWGIVDDMGVVSSSGYGDGSYTCYAVMNSEGKAIALRLDFIEIGDEDEEDYENDE